MIWPGIISDELFDSGSVPQKVKLTSATYCMSLFQQRNRGMAASSRLKKVVFLHDNAHVMLPKQPL